MEQKMGLLEFSGGKVFLGIFTETEFISCSKPFGTIKNNNFTNNENQNRYKINMRDREMITMLDTKYIITKFNGTKQGTDILKESLPNVMELLKEYIEKKE